MIRARRFCAVIVTIVAGGCQPPPADTVLTGRTMGTTYTVRITGCPQATCGNRRQHAITMLLEAQEQRFSHYREDSEISRFNRHAATGWFPVSAEFAELAVLAREISALSNGAFDITVAPAVNKWGFGPARTSIANPGDTPDETDLANIRQDIGYRNLRIRQVPPALGKNRPTLTVDMSAIAKGHAVDQVACLLEQNGHDNYLVEIGGELRTAGNRPDGKSWRIGLESAQAGTPVEIIVTPGNNAVATSGDYRNYFERDGKRYSHMLDPASSRPVDNGLTAVSVIAPGAAQADALATALLVAGAERGMQLATENDIAALFTAIQNNTTSVRYSPAFAAYLPDSD